MILKIFSTSNMLWFSSLLILSHSQALGQVQLSATMYCSIFRILYSRGSQAFSTHGTFQGLVSFFAVPVGPKKYLADLFIKYVFTKCELNELKMLEARLPQATILQCLINVEHYCICLDIWKYRVISL